MMRNACHGWLVQPCEGEFGTKANRERVTPLAVFLFEIQWSATLRVPNGRQECLPDCGLLHSAFTNFTGAFHCPSGPTRIWPVACR